jgi:CBS domain-containing protein
LPADTSVGAAIRRAMRSVQTDFPVSEGARLVGLVTANDLLDAAAHGRAALSIGAIAHPIAAVAAPGEPVEEALRRLEQSTDHVLPVLDADRLVGLLVPRNVLELAGLRDATAA